MVGWARWLMAGGAALALVGCSSPTRVVEDFCRFHTTGQYSRAYALLTERDRGEVSEQQYNEFEWDRQSFDLRLLQGHDLCGAAPLVVGDAEALVTLQLKKYASELSFSCVVPLVKERGDWRVTRHWTPIEGYRKRLKSLRDELRLKLEDLLKVEELAAYRTAADTAMKDYFQALDKNRENLLTAGGGAVPPFCEAALNQDHGLDLAFKYLAFEEKGGGKPADLVRATARVQALVDFLRQGYPVLASTRTKDARLDLIYANVDKVEDERGRVNELVHNRLAFWGQFRPPMEWRINIFEKGEMVQEGFGRNVEFLLDMDKFVPEAPPVAVGIIDFPRLPTYTNALKVTLTEADQVTSYVLDYPVRPEILIDKQ